MVNKCKNGKKNIHLRKNCLHIKRLLRSKQANNNPGLGIV